MKNMPNTAKYLVATLAVWAAVFLTASTAFAQYDDGSYNVYGDGSYSYDDGSYNVYGDGSYYSAGDGSYNVYGDGSYGVYGSDGSYNVYGDGSYPSGPTVSTPAPVTYSPVQYEPVGYYGGVVTSGGAYGGTVATPVYYGGSGTITVGDGGASGGTPATPVTYSPIGPTTVVSGGGTNYYYPVQTTSYIPNQVLAYTDTRDPNLSSVYLSDVPYTGAGDVVKVILFTLALILWSFAVTFFFMKRKANLEFAPAVKAAWNKIVRTKTEDSRAVILTGTDADLEILENYARDRKVLLSSDAAKKLIKLERLGKADAKRAIRNAAKADWLAFGEKDIEKYL